MLNAFFAYLAAIYIDTHTGLSMYIYVYKLIMKIYG